MSSVNSFQAIIVLLCFMMCLPSSLAMITSDQSTFTYVVDQSSQGDFNSIQDAIDASSDGDHILIKKGIYHEHILIDKKINIIGESQQQTIIDAEMTGDCVFIAEDGVSLSKLTIRKSGCSGSDSGIQIQGNFTSISKVIIMDCTIGIYLRNSHNNTILNNTCASNKDYGLYLHSSSDNYIARNRFSHNRWGVFIYHLSNNNFFLNNRVEHSSYYNLWLSWCFGNTVEENMICSASEQGIFCFGIQESIIQKNHIKQNKEGVYLNHCSNVLLSENTFMENDEAASMMDASVEFHHNYWNRFRILPKIIPDITPSVFPVFTFDLYPAKKPISLSNTPSSVHLVVQENGEEINVTKELPDSFDWRNVNGIDFSTEVKNQVPAPTCEAYALCASLETKMQYELGHQYEPDLSETHLYFYAGGTYRAGGVLLGDAAEYLVTTGVPDEGCFPDPHRAYDYPFESLSGWEKRTVRITEWGWVDFNEDAIKHALIEYGPLIICVRQRMDFLTYDRGVYSPFPLLPMVSGHVITLVGFDDDQQCWIVKNSAGSNWGENGYVRISYDAHTKKTPIFSPFYGGSGILYIDGIYGNMKPDVPKIEITNLLRQHTYLHRLQFPTIRKELEAVPKAIPRIMDWAIIDMDVENTLGVRFYLDGKLMAIDDEPPFSWKIQAESGFHTVEAIAFNDLYYSKAIRDFYMF